MRSSIRKGRRTTLRFSRQLCKIVLACATACFYSLPINYHRVVFAQTTCTQPPLLGSRRTGPQNSDITVNVAGAFGDPRDPNSLASCIRSAFLNWSNNPNTAVFCGNAANSLPFVGLCRCASATTGPSQTLQSPPAAGKQFLSSVFRRFVACCLRPKRLVLSEMRSIRPG